MVRRGTVEELRRRCVVIITPLGRTKQRDYALLFPGHRRLGVMTTYGQQTFEGKRAVEKALTQLVGFQCYVNSHLEMMKYSTGASSWCLSTWRGRETGISHIPTGVRITSLRGTLDGSRSPFEDLTSCLDWVGEYGISPASISSMAWSLWRASLPGEVSIGFDAEVGRAGLYGGRQEITEPRTYSHMVSADLRAAYAHGMASKPYALALRSVSPETDLDPDIPGMAEASVVVPNDMRHAPLPVRLGPALIQFQYGFIRGIWTWHELASARAHGAEVRVSRSWAPRRTDDLFGTWWTMAQTGRQLPGAASTMAKAIANSLWGQFGMVGDDRAEIRWADEKGEIPYTVDKDPRKMPHAWTAHIAAETTARVRVQTYRAMAEAPSRPVHVDTDGIFVRSTSELPTPHGDGYGQWRVKERMEKVEVKAPQLYRWTCRGCGDEHAKWHYVASGISSERAPEVFRRGGTPTKVSWRAQFDACLPPAHANDVGLIEKQRREAIGLGAA